MLINEAFGSKRRKYTVLFIFTYFVELLLSCDIIRRRVFLILLIVLKKNIRETIKENQPNF